MAVDDIPVPVEAIPFVPIVPLVLIEPSLLIAPEVPMASFDIDPVDVEPLFGIVLPLRVPARRRVLVVPVDRVEFIESSVPIDPFVVVDPFVVEPFIDP